MPNEFTIELSSADFSQIDAWGAETMADELATNLTEYAASQHYAFVGPVSVSFEEHEDLPGGRFQLRSATVRGNVAPATSAAPSTRHPLIDIDGQRYLLTGPVTVIGRDAEADIVVDDPGDYDEPGTDSALIGLENADKLDDSDLIFTFYSDEKSRKEIEGQNVYANIPAIKAGSVVAPEDQPFVTGSSIINPLTVPWALKRYVPMIDKAIKKAGK